MKGDLLFKKAILESEKSNPDDGLIRDLIFRAHKLGNAKATYSLATWYLHGAYVKLDVEQGVDFLKIAAKENIYPAMFDLAVCFEKGEGIKQDKEAAFEYYLKAALSGDPESIYHVGRCYYHGIGIPKNKKLGYIWIDKANELGFTIEHT
jgi:TPR repeat protein